MNYADIKAHVAKLGLDEAQALDVIDVICAVDRMLDRVPYRVRDQVLGAAVGMHVFEKKLEQRRERELVVLAAFVGLWRAQAGRAI